MFNQNNLDKSSSPYLQQHKGNPIHWQEWSKEVLEHAKKQNKLLFISVGYATCHWCHVMAAEAFSNPEIAQFLNDNFVAIKVDREQRPDIDQYMMAFLIQQQGHGGWPLNVILCSDQKPLLAMTYVPLTPKYGMPGFLEILHYAKKMYETNHVSLEKFILEVPRTIVAEEKEVVETLIASFDAETASFHHEPQFPPHNTLLFLLAYYEETKQPKIKMMLEKMLDTIAMRGLQDHLQGGFYRYCVDQNWTIPHFEKMLYDQALLLWVYSAAYQVLKKEAYKEVAEKIMQCLEETFEENNVYYSGHDADTAHHEGATYIWKKEELHGILTPETYNQFIALYDDSTNFEGTIHLTKKKLAFFPEAENKLLLQRKKRQQPFIDKKCITCWNALLGIGFVHAALFLEGEAAQKAKTKADALFSALLEKHYCEGKLSHSSLGSSIQTQEFLEDYASLLLFATYLYEEQQDNKMKEEMKVNMKEVIKDFFAKVKTFCRDHWIESNNRDFMEVPAQSYDHPTPSSVSLAEFAVFRAEIILGKEYKAVSYKAALAHDFHNLLAFYSNGFLHVVHGVKSEEREKLLFNVIVLPGEKIEDCYKGVCRDFSSIKELLKYLA